MGAAGLLLLLLVWLSISSAPSRGGSRERPASGSEGAQPTVDTRPSPPAHAAAPPRSSADLARNAPPGVLEVPMPIRLLNERSPYPPWCQPLTEGTDPSRTVPEDNPVDAKTGIHVVMGPRKFVVHPPDPMIIDVKVLNRLGAPLPITNAVARFRPDGTTVESGPWFEAPLVDDGTGADFGARDLAYAAALLPSDDQKTALFKGGEHVFVEVAFEAPNGLGLMRYALTLTYSREPNATLNGKDSDQVTNGNLVVSVGVTATQAGTYRVIGSLYSGDGQRAIAFASASAAVSLGDGSIPLSFFGKAIHDSGIDGPYELRYMMLFERVEEGREIAGDTVDDAYTTAAYSAKSFPDTPWVPPLDESEVVDMNSPSQQGKPGPLFTDDQRPANHGAVNPPATLGKGPPGK
jgi:hypothetical protein